MTPPGATVTPEWLSLREPADHRARARHLVTGLRTRLPAGRAEIHDLGSGTGSMTRWLAPQLPQEQHWVLHDVDEGLLARAFSSNATRAGDGSAISISTRHRDVTTIDAGDVAEAALVTTSALLDLLTAEEVTRIAKACVEGGSPALFTLSVTGRVQLTPRHPLDAAIGNAFNAHQRRTHAGRRLLGPDAVAHATTAFTRLGAEVLVADTPWRLGPDDVGLLLEWLTGWVAAACEQHPELTDPARRYLRQRRSDAAAGLLQVSVGHADLLAVGGPARVEPRVQEARVAARGVTHG